MRALFWGKWVKNRKFLLLSQVHRRMNNKNEYIFAYCVKLKWEGATKSARGVGGILLIRWACLLGKLFDRPVGPLDVCRAT